MLKVTIETTIKEYIQDSPVKFLQLFNHAYPTMEINGNCLMVGMMK